MDLKDKVVIITGASSGIGKELALQMARQGAKVILAARNRVLLDDLSREINSQGNLARAVPTDVSRREQVEQLVAEAIRTFGRLDIFVANAGISHPSRDLMDLTENEFRQVMETNLMGTAYAIWAAVPAMQKSGGGQIVVVSSVIGHRGIPQNAGYCASKFALQGLTESIRPELKAKGIHVLTVCPPGVDTPFFTNNFRVTERRYRLHSVEKIAQMIIRAIQKKKREVWLTMDAKLLIWLNRLCPATLDWMILAAKARMPMDRIADHKTSGGRKEEQ